METAEKILEDCLNDIGMSINRQLLPHNIKINELNKVKKTIIIAMKIFAKDRCKEQRQLCYESAQRTVLVKQDEMLMAIIKAPEPNFK